MPSKKIHYGGEIPQNHRRVALFKSPQMGIIHIAIGNWLNANWTLELPNAQAMVLSQTPCCSRSIGESSPRNSTNQGHLLVFWDAFFCTFDLQKSSYDVATDGSHDQSDTASHGSWGDTWDANLEYHSQWLKLVDTNGLIVQLPNSQVCASVPRRSSLANILFVQYRHRPPMQRKGLVKGHSVILIYVWDGWKKVKSKIITKTTNSRR